MVLLKNTHTDEDIDYSDPLMNLMNSPGSDFFTSLTSTDSA